jgi:hypothetical protein
MVSVGYSMNPFAYLVPLMQIHMISFFLPSLEMIELMKSVNILIQRQSQAASASSDFCMSPTSYGKATKDNLLLNDKYVRFVGDESKPSILSTEQVKYAQTLEREESLVKYLTPFFQGLCDRITPGMTVINCDNKRWLSNPSGNKLQDLKPSWAIIHRAMVRLRKEKNGKIAGKPVPEVIETLRAVGEAKVTLDQNAFGTICRYTRTVAEQFRGEIEGSIVRGILLSSSKFILVESNRAGSVRATEGHLGAPGSFQLIQRFFSREDPLTKSFVLLCEALGVKEHHTERSEGWFQSFLGKDRFGSTFVVRSSASENEICALKIFVSKERHGTMTMQEFELLAAAHEKMPTHVVRVKKDSFVEGLFHIGGISYYYSGYLMGEVGVPLQPSMLNEEVCERICRSLNDLHRNDIHHGDARYPNVVICDGHYKWIDFYSVTVNVGIIFDVKCLIDSFNSPVSVDWNKFADKLDLYAESLDVEHLLAIYRESVLGTDQAVEKAD